MTLTPYGNCTKPQKRLSEINCNKVLTFLKNCNNLHTSTKEMEQNKMNRNKTTILAFITDCQANIDEMQAKLDSPHCRKRAQWQEIYLNVLM